MVRESGKGKAVFSQRRGDAEGFEQKVAKGRIGGQVVSEFGGQAGVEGGGMKSENRKY